jgi:hypothetical protein
VIITTRSATMKADSRPSPNWPISASASSRPGRVAAPDGRQVVVDFLLGQPGAVVLEDEQPVFLVERDVDAGAVRGGSRVFRYPSPA